MISLGRWNVSFSIPLITLTTGRSSVRSAEISERQLRRKAVGTAITSRSLSATAALMSEVTSIESGIVIPGSKIGRAHV